MQSAFGIDHGEISKAIPFTPAAKRKKEQQRAVAVQRAARQQKIRRGAVKVARVPGKVATKRISIADVGSGAGKGVTRVGLLVAKKPALTGAALLGGGAYGGYKLSQKPAKKKYVAQ